MYVIIQSNNFKLAMTSSECLTGPNPSMQIHSGEENEQAFVHCGSSGLNHAISLLHLTESPTKLSKMWSITS